MPRGLCGMQGSRGSGIWGDAGIELFDKNGGAVLKSAPDVGGSWEESYHLTYLSGPKVMVAADNFNQWFYNLSGDVFGPSIYAPEPLPIPYRDSGATIAGNIDDPSGISSSEYEYGSSGPTSLPLDPGGDFSFDLVSLPVGDTAVTIRAWDIFANQSDHVISVTRLDDTDGPMISQCQLTPASGSSGTVFTFGCEVIDLDSSVADCSAAIRDAAETIVANIPMSDQGGDIWGDPTTPPAVLLESTQSILRPLTRVRTQTRVLC